MWRTVNRVSQVWGIADSGAKWTGVLIQQPLETARRPWRETQ